MSDMFRGRSSSHGRKHGGSIGEARRSGKRRRGKRGSAEAERKKKRKGWREMGVTAGRVVQEEESSERWRSRPNEISKRYRPG
jgi:hypothetical protein